MKRILITGAAGFLGSHLCDRFLSEGYSVIGMDNYITGDKKNIQHLLGNSNFEFIEHDVTEFINIQGQLDYILHFASPASPIDYLKIPIQKNTRIDWIEFFLQTSDRPVYDYTLPWSGYGDAVIELEKRNPDADEFIPGTGCGVIRKD